ncbi:cation channel sperm-associated protein 3 isoform X1 [Heterocephalus glaber]|uniref:Cation channel sperm-associated protein 3 isoform X1 n=1 Tax=Heterocephalus glaber TaxID=10181 RepID=A0AAX6NSY5_HETGA|nr:cation channel sperm-associated protein 3 isoform X1 [Heterocephalus glaber]
MSEPFQQDSSEVFSSSLFDIASDVLYERFRKFKRKDEQCQAFVKRVITSRLFKIIMISTISVNAFFMVLWTDYKIRYRLFRLFEISEMVFVAIYTSEFSMKVYVDPINYWKDGYNLLDVVIIIIIFIPYVLHEVKGKHFRYLNITDGIQSLRILKLITYSQAIRTLITAMGQIVYIVASVLILFFILLYIFAILGFYLFGVLERGDMNNWGSLDTIFFTLFSLATVEGWTDMQTQLEKHNFIVSRAFTIIFILLASFIFLSVFVGVIIMPTEVSLKKFEQDLMLEKHMEEKMQMILKQQQEEMNRWMPIQKTETVDKNLSELMENLKKSRRDTDPMVLSDFATSLLFIDIYLSILDKQDTTVKQLQELYCKTMHMLGLMLKDLPQKKKSESLEKIDEK